MTFLLSPVEYSLWCDYFEDPNRVEESWFNLVQDITREKLIQRLLIASGPVTFTLKHSLYLQLIGNSDWHYYIYKSLLHSQFDALGQIDRTKAREILNQLIISQESHGFKELVKLFN